MTNALLTSNRLEIQTRYGDVLVSELRSLGCKWDPIARAWWIGLRHANTDALLDTLLDSGVTIETNAPGGQHNNSQTETRNNYRGLWG